MASRSTAAALALVAGAALALTGPPGAAEAAPRGGGDVTAVLFEWDFASVARACTDQLGPAGYGSVQVSPPAEHIQGSQWWTSYQPVSYRIAGRLGGRTAFSAMVASCHAAGVNVIADAVVNHMSAGSGTGTGGSPYTKYDYPGLYTAADMDDCTAQISDYRDRANVQNCELVGLADLDTGEEHVRASIAGYLDDLLSLGVDGFRVDAAKHIRHADGDPRPRHGALRARGGPRLRQLRAAHHHGRPPRTPLRAGRPCCARPAPAFPCPAPPAHPTCWRSHSSTAPTWAAAAARAASGSCEASA